MPKFGDTPQHDHDKCASCVHLTEIKGRSFKEHIRHCGNMPEGKQLPPVVTACNLFRERNRQSLHEMHMIAWVLTLDQKKRDIGFKPPKKSQLDPDDQMWVEAQRLTGD
jgi:hypothetical protein